MLLPDTCDVPLCSCFNTRDLVRYAQVCRDARRAVQSYNNQAYQLHRTLAKFMSIEEVRAFRQVMRDTGTLISGSVAIHFFRRTPVGESGLDLYTEGDNAHDLAAFVQMLGYVYQPRMYQDTTLHTAIAYATARYAVRDNAIYEMPAILDKFTFDREGTKIHVLVADLSALDAVLDFHSSPVMNFISFRSAYSLYPNHTFMKKFGIVFVENISHVHVDKYRNLGWQIQRSVSRRLYDKMGLELKAPVRYVGDKHTWTIDLDDRADSYLEPVILNSWELQWSYRPQNYIMPQVARLIYIAPRSSIQSRVFASSGIMKTFMTYLATIERDEMRQCALAFMLAAFKSAEEHIFDLAPPCLTDVIGLVPRQNTFRNARLPVVTCGQEDRLTPDDPDAPEVPGQITLQQPSLVAPVVPLAPVTGGSVTTSSNVASGFSDVAEDLALIRALVASEADVQNATDASVADDHTAEQGIRPSEQENTNAGSVDSDSDAEYYEPLFEYEDGSDEQSSDEDAGSSSDDEEETRPRKKARTASTA